MRTSVGTKLVVLSLALSVPSSAYAASCTNLCSLNSNTAKQYINDAKCKNDPKCVDCVTNSMLGGQSGAYCTAATKSKKGAGIETVTAVLNIAAAATCAVACVSQYGDKLCGILGLGVMATEVASTLAGLGKGDQGIMSLVGLAPQALTVKSNLALAKTTKSVFGKATSQSNMSACINMAIYGITGYAKMKGKKKMENTANSSCMAAQQLAAVGTGATQSCVKGATPSSPPVLNMAGLFTTTKADNYPTPTVNDVDNLAATAGSTKYLKDMKDDLLKMEEAGKINLADIAAKVEAGEKPSSILAGMGVSGEAFEELKRQEDRIDRGEKSPLLAAIIGDGTYNEGGSAGSAAGSESGASELAFGGGVATPGEGPSATLEIDRKPSEAQLALGNGDDVFHQSFGGSIFDIVSLRIKESKGNYAELDPEGRMNRVFNGYSDPTRQPASTKPASRKGEAR